MKVSLSGDAGDELFGGYTRYFLALAFWRKLAWLPAFGRQLSADVIRVIPAAAWNAIGKTIGGALPGGRRERPLAGRVSTAAELLKINDREELYYRLVSDWKRPAEVVIGGSEPPTPLNVKNDWPDNGDFADLMMYLDDTTYLPDEILAKVDRAAMAVSLETRVPFLDHRVVEYAWQLPLSYKIRDGEGKWILRAFADYVRAIKLPAVASRGLC